MSETTPLPTATRVRKGSKFVVRVSCPDGTSFDVGGARAERANAIVVAQNFTLNELMAALRDAKPFTVTMRGGRRTLGASWTVDPAAEAREILARITKADEGDERYIKWLAANKPGSWGQVGVRADIDAAFSEANRMNERCPLIHFSVVLIQDG